MNRHDVSRTGMLLLLVFLPSLAQVTAQDGPVAKLTAEFDTARQELDAPLRSFNRKYEAELEKLEAKVTAGGDLDQVLAVRKERAAYSGGGAEVPESFADLRRLQAIYKRGAARIGKESQAKRRALIAAYQIKFDTLKKVLTQENQIEQAVAAKAMADQLLAEYAGSAPKPTPHPTRRAEPLVADDFERDAWGEGWEAADVFLRDGQAVSRVNGSWIRLNRPFPGNIRLEVDFDKADGPNSHSEWDFKARLSGRGQDRVALVRYEGQHVDHARFGPHTLRFEQEQESGTLVLCRAGGLQKLTLRGNTGEHVSTPWHPLPPDEDLRVVIDLAGHPDTERMIDRLRVYPLSNAEAAEAEAAAPAGAGASSAKATAFPSYLAKYPMVEGFSRMLSAPSGGDYATHRRVSAPSSWAYAKGNGQTIEWVAPELERRHFAVPRVTFVWGGANGDVASTWDLYLNGKRMITAETKIGESKIWREGSAALYFEYSHRETGNQGKYYLTVPRSELQMGKEQRFKWVENKASPESLDWIMINHFTDMTNRK